MVDNFAKNQKTQTRYLQNAAYVRLKNLQIGYTIPAQITRKIGVSNLSERRIEQFRKNLSVVPYFFHRI
ncbi:hypothetical protein C5Z03_15530 [Bacteroides thetaiotaomicron]|uniref:Outer membrane protein n=1 Tax=Bacteroides thetaiotaomicron (strain ATCC 29148 / DSM 2079 / JCM 5827 / CCUG 10774 / NCTC 10582 / VPI-5482 / E50) TaxID=226186 RepID=Q89YP5_BACTN|nr:putative outer membrane protein [Bacteroides thetaiotaomicron VPI-5482]PQL38785.1 hypothetical protein C5Z03_15530 [Bacteroides thetaiotaomicron]QMW86992.1 hypothetical protein FE838_13450 [Bacteroides thetaiotaomicron]